MWSMLYPIIIIVAANTIYNVCTKSTPSKMNSFAALFVTYIVAAVISFIMFFVTSKDKNIFTEFTKINWAPFVLGIVIVGLELGYILAYQNGWQMNKVSVTANITLAVILIFIAFIFYKESLTVRQIIGVFVCAGGLALISL
ncbi:MAG: EamA family transporter [Eubacterium sp.]|nr:EamA family transporter [Eubacterium sp.]